MRPMRRGIVLLATLVLAAAACEAAPAEQPVTGDADQTPGAPTEPVEEDPLAFTFTGEDGEAGCTYEGPTTLAAGSHPSSLTNTSADFHAVVNIARLAEGHTYADYLAYLAEHGDDYPSLPPPQHDNPAAHDWLDGDAWRSVHSAAPGEAHAVDALPLTAGEYAAFCWNNHRLGAGPRGVWPATPLTVTE